MIRMGTVIPFDGDIVDGEAMINQASLTGESVSVRKTVGSYAYAGTVVEEGEITVGVKQVSGNSRFDKIVTMIEESEKLKSGNQIWKVMQNIWQINWFRIHWQERF